MLDVLLRGNSDHEGWDVDHLLANSDVSLSDEDASVVNRVGDLLLLDEGLQASLHELVNGKTQDIIELSLRFLQETKSDHTSDKSIT